MAAKLGAAGVAEEAWRGAAGVDQLVEVAAKAAEEGAVAEPKARAAVEAVVPGAKVCIGEEAAAVATAAALERVQTVATDEAPPSVEQPLKEASG